MLRVLGLCSGVGGMELSLRLALGGGARPVCYVERESFAASVLMARMDDETLERAPIWDDLETFDARAWRGAVDLVVAGFPCQPWSAAGQRRGLADERWLWPHIARVFDECGAPLLFLENVPGIYRHGLREVLSDLAARGCHAEWLGLSASDVGAPQIRERVFVLAWRGRGLALLADRANDGRVLERAAHYSNGRDETGDEPNGRHTSMGDTMFARLAERSGYAAPPFAFPPRPSDPDGWERWLAAGGPLPGIRGSAPGFSRRLDNRRDRVRVLGNTVVPAQAARALVTLIGRATEN